MMPHRSAQRGLLLAAILAEIVISQPAEAQVQTILMPSLPALPDDGQPPRDGSPVICRPPEHQSGTRLLSPPVCKTQRQWDDLHARGLDLSIDGKSTYSTSQKYRSLNLQACRNPAECPP